MVTSTYGMSDEELIPIVYWGYETPQIDYKKPGNWREWSRATKAELVRDIMGLANADVPGYIIIGATTEGGTVTSYDGLDEDKAASFDPSKIADKVKRYADPEVSFVIKTPSIDGKRYVVIRVWPFQALPHICRDSYGDILEEGAIYVRGEGARTIKIPSADHMRKLVDRSTQISADTLVNRIRELVQYSQEHKVEVQRKFEAQVEEIRKTTGSTQ